MSRAETDNDILVYKGKLAGFIDNRPSGTRQRIADALGKHRSFVTQITSVSYPTPVPLRHLPAIFGVCRLSPDEKAQFLQLYERAHPQYAGEISKTFAGGKPMRSLAILVHDLGSEEKNRAFDEAIADFVRRIGSLMTGDANE